MTYWGLGLDMVLWLYCRERNISRSATIGRCQVFSNSPLQDFERAFLQLAAYEKLYKILLGALKKSQEQGMSEQCKSHITKWRPEDRPRMSARGRMMLAVTYRLSHAT